MGRITATAAAGLTAVLLITGCGGDGSADSDDPAAPAPTATPTLRDATGAIADEEAAAGEALDLGDQAEFGDLTMTIAAAEWGDEFTSDGIEFRDVHATVRWENLGAEAAAAELTWLVVGCPRNEDPDDQSSGFHSGPVDLFDDTPARSFVEGAFTASVVLPCEDARIVWQPEFDGPMWRWPIGG